LEFRTLVNNIHLMTPGKADLRGQHSWTS